MTQRKFEHKTTGWTAEKRENASVCSLYSDTGYYQGLIDHQMVFPSTDWQEITPELVEGRWYVAYSGQIFRLTRIKDREVYGDNFAGKSIINPCESHKADLEDIEREATPTEIHKALDAIRVEKGLVEGVKVKFKKGNAPATIKRETVYHPETDDLRVNSKIDAFTNTWITIYREGNWATKLSEPILVTEDGYEVYDGNTDIFIVEPSFRINRVPYNDAYKWGTQKYFYKEENAQSYIENNKPIFSRADLEFLENEVKEINKACEEKTEVIRAFKSTIQNLKQSK